MTDKEIAEVIADMVIMVDNREKKNDHVIDFLKENKIQYESVKLDTADYTFRLPNYPDLEIDNHFLVERKGSINEICGNLTTDRERFKREFERIGDRVMHIVLEDVTWRKILRGSYRSKFNPKSFMASLLTFSILYDVKVWFVTKEESGEIIYNILKYELRNYLKEIQKNG